MPQFILTAHAKERLRSRRMAESDIGRVLTHPEKTFPGKKSGTIKFIKELDGRVHHVVGKYLEDEKKWLVLSVWIRGEEDSNWIQDLAKLIGKGVAYIWKILVRKNQH